MKIVKTKAWLFFQPVDVTSSGDAGDVPARDLVETREPPMSFYAVYDGHAGKDAAAFAASHVHSKILESPHFPADPVAAIRDGFSTTDEIFLDKLKTEVSHSSEKEAWYDE